MRSLLPWINSTSRDPLFWQDPNLTIDCKPSLPKELSKPFALKTINKHVSDYEKPLTPETTLFQRRNTTNTVNFYRKKPQGEASCEIAKMKRQKNKELVEKSTSINSKFHVPLMKTIKSKQKAMKVSHSLKRFQSQTNENEKPSMSHLSRKTKFHFYPAHSKNYTHVGEKMREFKPVNHFRSKWFAEMKSLK